MSVMCRMVEGPRSHNTCRTASSVSVGSSGCSSITFFARAGQRQGQWETPRLRDQTKTWRLGLSSAKWGFFGSGRRERKTKYQLAARARDAAFPRLRCELVRCRIAHGDLVRLHLLDLQHDRVVGQGVA